MVAVVLNPASGSGEKPGLEPHLNELFRAAGIESRIVRLNLDQADTTVQEIIGSRPDVIVAAGGDGTISTVARALARSPTPLGILPLGTMNHFAKDLRIPLKLEDAVQTIARRHVTSIDLGLMNNRVFLNNSSIGIYPNIIEAREALKQQGHDKWTALALATARVLPRSREILVRLEAQGHRVVSRTPFVFIGNNKYLVEGMHLGARERIDAGELFAYLAPRLRTRELPKLVLWAMLGRATRHDAFEIFSATELWVEMPQKRRVLVSTDGEVGVAATPLHYKVMPRALNVIVPPPSR